MKGICALGRILSLTSGKETVFFFFLFLCLFFVFKKDRRKHQSQGKRFLIFVTLKLTFLHRKSIMGGKASRKVTIQDSQNVPLRKGLWFFFNSTREKENLLNCGGVLASYITKEKGLGQADRAPSIALAMGDAITCTLAQAGQDVGVRSSPCKHKDGSQHGNPGMPFVNWQCSLPLGSFPYCGPATMGTSVHTCFICRNHQHVVH